MLTVKIPASTSNLGAGFDVFGLALRTYLHVTVKKRSGNRKKVQFAGEGSEYITKSRSNNYITSALHQVFKRRGRKVPGYEIKVRNSIPVSRGLGSSGSAIIAGVTAANYLGELGLSDHEILHEAVRIEEHPDNICPSFAGGLTAALQLNNGEIRYIKQKFPPDITLVFVIPDFHISTKKARDILPRKYTRQDIIFNLQRVSLLFESVRRGDYSLLSCLLKDRLHQSYRAPLVPGLENVLNMEAEHGLVGVYLSGSGPTVCAFTTDNSEEIAGAITQTFSRSHIDARVLVLQADNKGTAIKRDD